MNNSVRKWLRGRASPCQGEGREFESRLPLHFFYPVIIATRPHLFPSRTQKLSSLAPMILGGKLPGKVGRCRLKWLHGQAVKTPPFHGGNPGSIPGGVTSLKTGLKMTCFLFSFCGIYAA